MSFSLWVPIPPKVKQRPRLGRRRKAYTPEETILHERAIAAAYQEAGGPFFEAGVPVALEAVYTPDGSWLTITEADSYPRGLRGDLDNYYKATADGLNGVAYEDDRQVVIVGAMKAPRGWEPDE